jgi:hypothetical protein
MDHVEMPTLEQMRSNTKEQDSHSADVAFTVKYSYIDMT